MAMKCEMLDQLESLCAKQSTAKTYRSHCEGFIRYHYLKNGRQWINPKDMCRTEIEQYLTHLAKNQGRARSTQDVALNAILFLYREVLGREITGINAVRSIKPVIAPTVLARSEIQRLFNNLEGAHLLIAQLMYGSGLRVSEAVSIRVKDLDFDGKRVFVRQGKRNKDRVTVLCASLVPAMKRQISAVDHLRRHDLSKQIQPARMPSAKFRDTSLAWCYLFPRRTLVELVRDHVTANAFWKSLKRAAVAAGIHKRVHTHALRHSFATHFLEDGGNIRLLQRMLGHADISMTEKYLHIAEVNTAVVESPLTGWLRGDFRRGQQEKQRLRVVS